MSFAVSKTLRSFPRVKKGQKVSAALVNAWADAIEELCRQTRLGEPDDVPAAAAGRATRPFTVSARIEDGKLRWACPRGIVYGDGTDTRVVTDIGDRAGSVDLFGAGVFGVWLTFPMKAVVPTLGELAAVRAEDLTYKKYELIESGTDRYGRTTYAPGNPQDAQMQGAESLVQAIESANMFKVFSDRPYGPAIQVMTSADFSALRNSFREKYPLESGEAGQFDGYFRGLWTVQIAEIAVKGSEPNFTCAVENFLHSDFFLFGQGVYLNQ